MIPGLDRDKDAGTTANIRAHVRLAPGTSAITQVLSFHVNTVESVWSGSQANRFDIIHRHFAGIKRHANRLPGELFSGFLGTADKPCHPGADNGDFSL